MGPDLKVLKCGRYGFLKKDLSVEDVIREYEESCGVKVSGFAASKLLETIRALYSSYHSVDMAQLESCLKEWEADWVLEPWE